MKDSPRSTTQVPTSEQVTAASNPAMRARCMKAAVNGSNSASASACIMT